MKRSLTIDEKDFLYEMLKMADAIDPYLDMLNEVNVQEMDDGGMGSLAFIFNEEYSTFSQFGCELIAVEFKDVDGVFVIATIYLDQFDRLYELDIWKVDFSPLINSLGSHYKIIRVFT